LDRFIEHPGSSPAAGVLFLLLQTPGVPIVRVMRAEERRGAKRPMLQMLRF